MSTTHTQATAVALVASLGEAEWTARKFHFDTHERRCQLVHAVLTELILRQHQWTWEELSDIAAHLQNLAPAPAAPADAPRTAA